MTMFDRLTGLAQRALNKTPAPAQTPCRRRSRTGQ